MPSTSQFLGLDSFVWFQGVVEDRFDPEKLGRIRVRILGLHTQNKTDIPTEELFWAYPISPITSAAMNGIGETPLGPLPGTWVVGFFRDGENCQDPVIMGTLGGIPQEGPNGRIGFNDPKENYPKQDFLEEPDMHRLARREKLEQTIWQKKVDTMDLNVDVAHDKSGNRPEPWSEPKPQSHLAQYPYNHVWETESGHTVEWDNTPNNERLHEYHKVGTFYEIQSDGTKITKVVRDNYSLVYGDEYVHIHGNVNIRIGGEVTNVLIVGNANIEVQKEAYVVTGDNTKIDVHGDLELNVDDDFKVQVGGDMSVAVAGNFGVNAETVSIAALTEATLHGHSYAGLTSLGKVAASGLASVQLTGALVGVQGTARVDIGSAIVDIEGLAAVQIKSGGIISNRAPIVTRGGNPFWS